LPLEVNRMPREQQQTCTATRLNGEPCKARALGVDRPFCWAHAPELAAKRDAARANGGLRSQPLHRIRRTLPTRLSPVAQALEKALVEVHDGKLEPSRATAMAALARALISVLEAAEVEERVRRLEALVNAQDRRAG
jgi:hypothetical protein